MSEKRAFRHLLLDVSLMYFWCTLMYCQHLILYVGIQLLHHLVSFSPFSVLMILARAGEISRGARMPFVLTAGIKCQSFWLKNNKEGRENDASSPLPRSTTRSTLSMSAAASMNDPPTPRIT